MRPKKRIKDKEKKKMKYPTEIVSYVRKKTFSIDAHFVRATEDAPLAIFDKDFSRFSMCIITDSKAATCNFPINELAKLERISNYAFNKAMEIEYQPASNTVNNSPAFTERFKTGQLNGKTPVEVLLEYGDKAKDMLNGQYKWLKDNLEKYPQNKKLMDAIVEAGKVDLSTIQAETVNQKTIKLIDMGVRPLIRKKREEDGKCFCYEVSAIWNFANDYPVTITIKNYYAPVIKKEDGTLNVQISQKDKASEINNSFSMTGSEWLNAVEQMKLARNDFRTINFASAVKMSDAAEAENRKAAKENKEQANSQ